MATNVRGATLANFAEVAAQIGLDPRVVLREAGVDRRTLSNPDSRIPAGRVVDLLERSAQASDCPTIGLRMAESRRLSNLGALSLLISHQATMREALLTVTRYRQLVNEALLIHVEEHDDVVVVREELLVTAGLQTRQSYELAVGVLYRIFRAVLGPRWRAQSVNFTHAAPTDLAVHRRIFGPITEFGSDFNGLTCRRADLDAPNPAADPVMAQFAEHYVRSLPNAGAGLVSQEVQKAIYLLLPSGEVSLVRIAELLGLSERTLQRRLAAENAEFGQLLDGARRDLAQRYLENPTIPMGRLAGMVGYSRQASFNRWFGAAFGSTPGAWRRRRIEGRRAA
jgi:AraC-like DNA-binding protein